MTAENAIIVPEHIKFTGEKFRGYVETRTEPKKYS